LPFAGGGGGGAVLEPVELLDVELLLAPEPDEELVLPPVKGSNSSATCWGVAFAADLELPVRRRDALAFEVLRFFALLPAALVLLSVDGGTGGAISVALAVSSIVVDDAGRSAAGLR
jgi:hypothetical protein